MWLRSSVVEAQCVCETRWCGRLTGQQFWIMRIVEEGKCSVLKNMLLIYKNILTLFVQNDNYLLLLLHPFN